MNAKEMFEQLGFKRYEEKQHIKYEIIREDDITIISFIVEIKSLFTNLRYLSSDLLKAINKQVEELWGDDILKNNGNK